MSVLHAGSRGAHTGFRAGIPAPLVPPLPAAPSTASPSQSQRPDTTSESFSTTTLSPENEPGVENDPPPMVCTFRIFPKIIFGRMRGTRTLSPPARD